VNSFWSYSILQDTKGGLSDQARWKDRRIGSEGFYREGERSVSSLPSFAHQQLNSKLLEKLGVGFLSMMLLEMRFKSDSRALESP
jgi:hypothetical protein